VVAALEDELGGADEDEEGAGEGLVADEVQPFADAVLGGLLGFLRGWRF
jgi:hypothetical protein